MNTLQIGCVAGAFIVGGCRKK